MIGTDVIEGTWYSVTANTGRRIGTWSNLHLLTSDEGIAKETVLATTVVASDGIDAYCVIATCMSITLVDI